jgi:polysaccharide pyruvyl transferase WcaK-like protein
MKNRIYFLPAGQVENLGDQLINAAMVDAVRPHGEVVIDDLETPRWFVDAICKAGDGRVSASTRRRFFLGLARDAIRQKVRGEKVRNYVILPPGHTSRRGLGQARAAAGRYGRLLMLRLLGCRVIRAGFSIGPFDSLNGIVESLGSRAFHFYGVRDRQSVALAQRYRFSGARYFPDLAWSEQSEGSRRVAPENGPVVVSFRSNAFGQVHSPEYLLPICRRLRLLLGSPGAAGRPVIVAYQVESDREASVEIVADLRAGGFSVERRPERIALDEAQALYGNACCVLSNRLHVLLLAAQCGSLPVALVHLKDNAKITSMLTDNGLDDLMISLDEDAETSLRRFDAILLRRTVVMAKIEKARRDNGRLIADSLSEIFRPPAATQGMARALSKGGMQ